MHILEIEILGQVIGFIALGISIFAFKEHDDRKVLIYLALCSFFWGIHFSMLGLYAAAGINSFDVFKNIAGLKWKRSKKWTLFFIISYIIIGIGVFIHTKSWLSFLPTLAAVLGSIGVIYFSGYIMRFFLLSTLFVWLIYNSLGGSIPGVLSDILLIVTSFYGIYSLKKKDSFKIGQ